MWVLARLLAFSQRALALDAFFCVSRILKYEISCQPMCVCMRER